VQQFLHAKLTKAIASLIAAEQHLLAGFLSMVIPNLATKANTAMKHS